MSQEALFFASLDANIFSPWLLHYVDHGTLRKALEKLSASQGELDVPSTATSVGQRWCKDLQEEVNNKVSQHFAGVARILEMKLLQVMDRAKAIQSHDEKKKHAMLQLLEVDLSKAYSKLKHLQEYTEHNYSLCKRLLKKFESDSGLSQLAADTKKMVKEGCCVESPKLVNIKNDILAISEQLGLDPVGHSLRYESQSEKEALVYAFLFGVVLCCVLGILLFLWVPAINPAFSKEAFSRVIPVFRCSFLLSLLLWTAGAVVWVLENYRVNYLIILNVDSSIVIRSKSLLVLALVQTLIFVLPFIMYLMDFKFGWLFDDRLVFEMYPMLQAMLSLALWMTPVVSIFPWMSACRRALASCLMMVLFCYLPVYEVTFASNLLGDVLTSFAKPLKDVVYTSCYMWQAGQAMFEGHTHLGFEHRARICHAVEATTISFLILVLPFVLRFLQCLKRYFSTRRHKGPFREALPHLLNAGKYAASILVSIVGFGDWVGRGWMSENAKFNLLILVSLIATLYSLTWDLHMDWGLLPEASTRGNCAMYFRQPSVYPKWVYCLGAFLDMLGRLTWASVLLPTQTFFTGPVSVEVGVLVLSSLEVLRRGFWTIIRIEHESVANSSKYRRELWLPPLPKERPSSGADVPKPGPLGNAKRFLSGIFKLSKKKQTFVEETPLTGSKRWREIAKRLKNDLNGEMVTPLLQTNEVCDNPNTLIGMPSKLSDMPSKLSDRYSKTSDNEGHHNIGGVDVSNRGVPMHPQLNLQKDAKIPLASANVVTAMYPDPGNKIKAFLDTRPSQKVMHVPEPESIV